ncbi:oligoendopeptidase F [Alicyclobacillus mengziensis]|uniref:Oligopeptidase F n=1 Tax=Alicyclobacillus mengziensis TaxID=2931921 RepID=A0A9X7W1G0_9BACL|nr:oligoendopeptidase F [Alicyclobacillus mengziensis]QSO48966.1 oligoendopeptidase F [Alicyclobacillus mengziensis]
MADRLKRAQVPEQETWNLRDLFETDDAWEEELRAIAESFDSVAQYKGHLADGAQVVLKCLDARETLATRFTRVSTYASLKFSEDGSNPLNQTNSDRVAALGGELNAATSFVDSELLELPVGTIESYLASLTGLEEHRNYLEQLALYKPYRLSAQTEAALAALGPVHAAPYAIYQRSKSSDMQFESVVDDEGNEHAMSAALYEDKFEQSSDTNLRRAAFRSFAKTLGQYQNTIAAAYGAEVKKQVTLARLRGYSSVTDMLLQPQQVPVELYNNILDVIQRDLAPHMRRLARLRQRVLGLDKMLHCDLKAPLDPAFQPKTTFEQASDTILGALSVLGDEYTDIIRKGLTSRWVDLADNIGKSTGAFCSSPYGVHPYILITWTDNMRSTFVLAHELGHAGHFSLAQRNQRYVNTRPSMTFVEAPSTMNEMLLGQYILKRSDDEKMRRWVLMQLLGTYYHNYVTHLLEGELQRRVYKLADAGTPMTATLLSQLKGNVLSEFWGDAVEIDDAAKLTWMRQPHYYMGLYPYTYSVGLTVSTLTAQRIFTEGQPAVDDWLRVLKAGGTKKPLELMKMAGVDMSTPEPIERAVAYVGTLVDELEKSFS